MSVIGSISIRDGATAVLRSIRKEQAALRSDAAKTRSGMKAAWDRAYTAKVDTAGAAAKTDGLLGKVKRLGREAASPAVRVKDAASAKISKISGAVKAAGRKVASPVVRAKDMASAKISRIVGAVKAAGRKVASPVIRAKDMASRVLGAVGSKMKAVGSMVARPAIAVKDRASAALSSIKSMVGTLSKGVTIAVGVAGAGLAAVVGGALSGGAGLEQSIGGVETLFRDSAGVVKENADRAFRTAGLSANSYMETVTGFSASLLQSLGGDTAKAAEIADMAIIDMADNANKMGTDMESIQNAYSGFAKQNYTMLDNLKLGYGGTKEEMQRLLKDARKISGVKYDINSLADVYSAIHVIQGSLDITGTTAKEASETFSGSFAAMKSSVSNLLGSLAVGGDVEAAVRHVVDSAATFLFANAVPMVGNVLRALPGAVSSGIRKAAPRIREEAPVIIRSLKDGLMEALASLAPLAGDVLRALPKAAVSMVRKAAPKVRAAARTVMRGLRDGLMDAFPSLAPVIGQGFDTMAAAFSGFGDGVRGVASAVGTLAAGFAPMIPQLMAFGSGMASTVRSVAAACLPALESIVSTVQTMLPVMLPVIETVVSTIGSVIAQAAPVIAGLVSGIGTVVSALAPVFSSIFSEIGEKVGSVLSFVGERMGFIQEVIGTVAPLVADIVSTAWGVISPVVDIAISVFKILFSVVQKVFPGIQSVIESVWGVVKPIVEGIGGAVSKVAGWFGNVADFFTGGPDEPDSADVGENAAGDNNWKGGLTWVGEKGPELVDLPKGSRILPNKESLSMVGTAKGAGSVKGTVANVVQNTVSGERAAHLPAGEPAAGIMDILRKILDEIRGGDGRKNAPDVPERAKPSGNGPRIIIQKLADKIEVRKEEDIDAVADRVAKRIMEVAVNMG